MARIIFNEVKVTKYIYSNNNKLIFSYYYLVDLNFKCNKIQIFV